MKRTLKHKLVAGGLAGAVVAGGGAAVAATELHQSPKEQDQAILKDAANQLGVQPSALSAALKKALENRVDAAVSDGRLTKEQGAELKARIAAGDVPFFGRGGGPGFDRHGDHAGFLHGLDAAGSYLGLSASALRDELDGGKTLAQVAKDRGKTEAGLVGAMVADASKRLDSAVSQGRLTKAQKERVLTGMKARITALVEGKAPRFERGRPGRDGDGFGGPPAGAPGF